MILDNLQLTLEYSLEDKMKEQSEEANCCYRIILDTTRGRLEGQLYLGQGSFSFWLACSY